MPRGPVTGDDVPLEVIDLEPELGARPDRSAPRPRRRLTRGGWGAVVVAVVVVIAAGLVATRHDAAAPPAPQPPADADAGRFYPTIDAARGARIVLPSGVAVVLTGDVPRTLGELGATFAGNVGPVGFRIVHGRPADLFDSLGAAPIRGVVAVAGAHARAPDLAKYGGRLAVIANAGWTLVAFLSDDEATADFQLRDLRSWELSPAGQGAIVRAPNEAVGDASVVLGDDVEHAGRRVELTEDNCAGTSVRTEAQLDDTASGFWCQDGVYVRISGPEAFVAHALATLRVAVHPVPS